jgi:quercetin dioxygenase-like cupin family protein
MKRALRLAAGILFGSALLTTASLAQEVKRTEIKREDLTGTNMQIIVQLVESPPGSFSPRHVPNGEEVYYVLEGGTIQAPGEPPQAREPGQTIINKRDVPHAGYKVVGDKTIKSLNIYIVDKGKPLAVPVQ